MNLTALRELEMTLGFSDDIMLFPPTQLKELTLSISKVASEPNCRTAFQSICLVNAHHSSLCKCSYG